MLPPKLAQIIVNLATGNATTAGTADSRDSKSDDKVGRQNTTVLDPFCGTGVILQEAALMGYKVYGTDLEPRMVDYSKANLDWLSQRHYSNSPTAADAQLEVGDATAHSWQNFDLAAAETYLGRPFSAHRTQHAGLPERQDGIGQAEVVFRLFIWRHLQALSLI